VEGMEKIEAARLQTKNKSGKRKDHGLTYINRRLKSSNATTRYYRLKGSSVEAGRRIRKRGISCEKPEKKIHGSKFKTEKKRTSFISFLTEMDGKVGDQEDWGKKGGG